MSGNYKGYIFFKTENTILLHKTFILCMFATVSLVGTTGAQNRIFYSNPRNNILMNYLVFKHAFRAFTPLSGYRPGPSPELARPYAGPVCFLLTGTSR